jgi:hypothetical protein
VILNDSTTYRAKFEVLNADTGSYTIKWSFKNYLFDLLKMPASSRKKLSQYTQTEVIYKTDELGAFIGIENWQSISNMVTALVNEMMNNAGKDKSTDLESLKQSINPLLSVYKTKRGIEMLVFNELQIFHFPFGHQYVKGDIYNYQELIPGLQENVPVKANGILFVRKADTENKTCELVQRLKILPDVKEKALRDFFKSIEMKYGAIEEAVQTSIFQVADNNIYFYNYHPGIPVKINVQRDTQIDVLENKIRKLDLTIIERIN